MSIRGLDDYITRENDDADDTENTVEVREEDIETLPSFLAAEALDAAAEELLRESRPTAEEVEAMIEAEMCDAAARK